MKFKKEMIVLSLLFVIFFVWPSWSQEKILDQFEQKGIWKVDRENHRCFINSGVWQSMPFEYKEKTLLAIYMEEKTWWKLYDYMSGKLLGEVNVWGVKIYP